VLDAPTITLSGINGQLEVHEDRLSIRRKGFLAKATQGFFAGEKTIYFNQITSIKVKQGGLLTNGFIQFSLAGNQEGKRGLLDQTKDENTVMFRKDKNEAVQQIREYIEKRRSSASSTPVSVADELTKFKALLDKNVLTQEEFDIKKRQLLNS